MAWLSSSQSTWREFKRSAELCQSSPHSRFLSLFSKTRKWMCSSLKWIYLNKEPSGCRRACAWALASLASSPAAFSYSWTCQWTWSDLPPYTFPAPGEEGAVRGYLYNWLEKCNKWEHAKSGGSGWERKWDRAGERRSRKVQVSINKTGIDPVREEWRRK